MVTGGNKGIGLELCRLFAKHGLIVVLSARSIERGLNALNHLKQQLIQEESKEKEYEGKLYFHQLDITDPVSISRFAAWIESTFGGLDILVNTLPLPSLICGPLLKCSFEYRNDDFGISEFLMCV